MHLDGARVFNAAVALGVHVSAIADLVTSVQFCLSKVCCALEEPCRRLPASLSLLMLASYGGRLDWTGTAELYDS